MAPIVIGLIGKARSGKDTVGEYLEKEHNYYPIAFAQYPKKILSTLYYLSREQLWGDLREVVDELSTCYKRLDKATKELNKYSHKDIKKLRISSKNKIKRIIQEIHDSRIRIDDLKKDLFNTGDIMFKLYNKINNSNI